MGGRGREYKRADRWSWIGELSDSRLENYGKMTSYRTDNDLGKEALNFECSKEYERRFGMKPEWSK